MKGLLGWFVVGYLYYLVITGKVVQLISVAKTTTATPQKTASTSSISGTSTAGSIVKDAGIASEVAGVFG